MSDSVRPHRQQPTRLPCPWDSPGKNAGVDCHFLLQCMKVKSESEVIQLCPTLCNPTDCSPPGSSAHGIFQARVLEWGAIAFSEKTNTEEEKTNNLLLFDLRNRVRGRGLVAQWTKGRAALRHREPRRRAGRRHLVLTRWCGWRSQFFQGLNSKWLF